MADAAPIAVDMGYEDCSPMPRRGSMTVVEEKERRASIKAIMADRNLSPFSKRRSIQHLMDGRRSSLSVGSVASSSGSNSPNLSDNEEEPLHETFTTPETYAFSTDQTRRAEETRPHCNHYERNCTLIAPCCGAAFGCRFCHDDCPILPPLINQAKRYHRSASLPSSFTSMASDVPEDNQHAIDRFAVTEVICRHCYTRQSSKTYVLCEPCSFVERVSRRYTSPYALYIFSTGTTALNVAFNLVHITATYAIYG